MSKETATENKSLVVIDNEMAEKKRSAWGNLGVQIYESEMKLQARAQQALAKIKIPTKIEEVANAEKLLKELKSEANAISTDRKAITSKFDDVSKRLMEPEKSFAPALEPMEKAIITLKKADQERQQKENLKHQKVAECREFLIKTKNNADAAFKTKINEKIAKVYEHALGKGEIDMDMLPEFILFAKTRMYEADFKIEYPLNTFSDYVTSDEYIKMCNEILIISAEPYLNQYKNDLDAKFVDYEVALKNKDQALAAAKQEQEAKAIEIKVEKVNADTTAVLQTMSVETPVVSMGLKELKQSFVVDMPETEDSVFKIAAAFAQYKHLTLPELNVTKWLSLTISQMATALAKVKTKDNAFAPTGIVFKTVDKL
jgi:hypothetical protein